MSESSKWILSDVLSASESSCILKLLHLLLKSVSHIHCCAVPVLEHQGSAESVWRCKNWTLTSASFAPQIVVVAQCGLSACPDNFTHKTRHWYMSGALKLFVNVLLVLMTRTRIYQRAASPEFPSDDLRTHVALFFRSVTASWLNVVNAECGGVDVESWERFLSSMQLIIFACYTFKVSVAHPAEKSVSHFWLSQP